MAEFVAHLIITSILLLVIAKMVRGVDVENWSAALVAALVLGLVNGFVRPLIILLTLPLTFLTLGLFLLVINALMLQLAAAITPGVRVEGCGAALWGSILLTVLNLVVAALIGAM